MLCVPCPQVVPRQEAALEAPSNRQSSSTRTTANETPSPEPPLLNPETALVVRKRKILSSDSAPSDAAVSPDNVTKRIKRVFGKRDHDASRNLSSDSSLSDARSRPDRTERRKRLCRKRDRNASRSSGGHSSDDNCVRMEITVSETENGVTNVSSHSFTVSEVHESGPTTQSGPTTAGVQEEEVIKLDPTPWKTLSPATRKYRIERTRRRWPPHICWYCCRRKASNDDTDADTARRCDGFCRKGRCTEIGCKQDHLSQSKRRKPSKRSNLDECKLVCLTFDDVMSAYLGIGSETATLDSRHHSLVENPPPPASPEDESPEDESPKDKPPPPPITETTFLTPVNECRGFRNAAGDQCCLYFKNDVFNHVGFLPPYHKLWDTYRQDIGPKQHSYASSKPGASSKPSPACKFFIRTQAQGNYWLAGLICWPPELVFHIYHDPPAGIRDYMDSKIAQVSWKKRL
jgi:hypothetical protein